ncbi:MAG TPA: hypothetical protein VFQ80_01055 [Thermomicrobiales bacterium]|jgi:hypothetical protein|nr:hypothetical protein [Thermomicrobiales bacterium]
MEPTEAGGVDVRALLADADLGGLLAESRPQVGVALGPAAAYPNRMAASSQSAAGRAPTTARSIWPRSPAASCAPF